MCKLCCDAGMSEGINRSRLRPDSLMRDTPGDHTVIIVPMNCEAADPPACSPICLLVVSCAVQAAAGCPPDVLVVTAVHCVLHA